MAIVRVKRFTSWSNSRLNDYDPTAGGCPAKARYKYLDKIPEPKSEAMERGTKIHTLCEEYIKGTKRNLPVELILFKAEFKRIRAAYKAGAMSTVFIEETWGFNVKWETVRWDDWTNCWLRVKLDLAELGEGGNTLYITDFKTGKFRPEKNEDYMSQLELYGLAGLLRFPTVKDVRARLLYLDHGVIYPEADTTGAWVIFPRAKLPALVKKWEKRVKPMLADTLFKPQPGNACRWCAYTADKGGPCVF